MPINTQHPAAETMSPRWAKVRDVFSGAAAVRANATKYLRIPAGREADPRPLYVNGATWFSASSRSLDGLAGTVMRKPPIVSVPATVEPWLKAVTPTGVPFSTFADQVVREVIAMGRVGVLVDVPSTGGMPYLSL